jgi:hypothetical protein
MVPCIGAPKLRRPSEPDQQTINIEKFSHLRNINKPGCSNPTLIMATYLKKKYRRIPNKCQTSLLEACRECIDKTVTV